MGPSSVYGYCQQEVSCATISGCGVILHLRDLALDCVQLCTHSRCLSLAFMSLVSISNWSIHEIVLSIRSGSTTVTGPCERAFATGSEPNGLDHMINTYQTKM